jgi:tripartite-type tricarboxylate transporter receptor subunit TctC
MRRRHLLAAASMLPPAATARAQSGGFPSRTVRIVVPYGPGGSSDIVARILAQRAGELAGQQFVVENRGGGASIPGTQAVATAPPDGYVVGTADNALTVNPGLFRDRLPYDTERDLGALGLAVTAPVLLLAHPTAPGRSLAEVLAAMRAEPGRIAVSHGGIGTPTHLVALQLQLATGLAFTQAGYRGGGPQVTGLVAGDVPYGLVAISSSIGHVQGGRLRALAVTSATRSPLLPEVPTTAEAGLPAMDLVGWWGFITPAGLRPEVQERLHALLLAPAREAAVRARLEGLGYSVVASGPAEFAGQIRREVAQWSEVANRLGLRAE